MLRSAEAAGYDVLLTVDPGIPCQQPPGVRKIAIVVIRSRTNQLEDLMLVLDAVKRALETIKPGEMRLIPTVE